ncbi:MAG: alpha/beta fold hydrolase [Candidatus Obscuribacterales bacterium]|nr:alpha/beta fold hydrolase [Candidatus Obscuribacterales bacterium]
MISPDRKTLKTTISRTNAGLLTGIAVSLIATATPSAFAGSVAAQYDAHPIKPRVYAPPADQKTKGIIVTVHGTTQHAGSFQSLAEHLVGNGFTVLSCDLRGHGLRYHGGGEEAVTKADRVVNYEKSADDLVATFKQIRSDYPGLPVYCIGESVGAGVVTRAAGSSKGLVDGMILCSAGTRPCFFNPVMVVTDFFKYIWRLDKPMDVARYIDHYSADDKRVSNEMIADPLSRIKLTPREILRTGWFIRRTPAAAKHVDPNVPVLIVQGKIDHIVGNHSIKAILKNLPTTNKTIVELPKCGHVLLGTSYLKPQVVESVTGWLNKVSSAPSVASRSEPGELSVKAQIHMQLQELKIKAPQPPS